MGRYVYQSHYVDGNGSTISSGTVKVYLTGTDTLATIYSSETSSAISGSEISTSTDGSFSFFVDPKDYDTDQEFRVVLSKTNFATTTYDDVSIFPDLVRRYQVDPDETDQGSTGNGFSIKAIVDSIGSNTETIYLRPGSYTLTTSETIPSNITLEFAPGAIIDGAGNLTINGAIKADHSKIFDSTLTVDLSSNDNNVAKTIWFNHLSDAVTAVGITQGKIIVNNDQTLTANVTTNIKTEIEVVNGSTLSGSFTLTVGSGVINAGLYKIFESTITVDGLKVTYPEWWGAIGDFTTDDTAAIAAAFAALNTGVAGTTGGRIKFTNRYLTDPITLGVSDVRLVIEGVSNTSTQIKLNDNSNDNLLFIQGGRVVIRDILFDGNRSNQTAGSVILVSGGVPHVSLYNVEAFNGYDYALANFGTTTAVFSSIFSSSNYGIQVGNNTLRVYGSTIEDNLSGGVFCGGSGAVIMALFSGCWFEDNAHGLTNPTYHINATGIGTLNAITVENSYFSGGTQPTIMGAISIAGSAINTWKFTNNQIFNCGLGAYALPGSMFAYFNDFRNNQVAGTTPAITDADRQPGFFFDDSIIGSYISPTMDLSGSAITHFPLTATGTRYVSMKKATAVYTEASSIDAGINIIVGVNGTADFLTYATEVSQAKWTTKDLTFSSANTTLDGDKTVTVTSPGGKTGTGEVAIQLDYILW